MMHTAVGLFYPLLHRLLPKHVTTTVNVVRAMIEVATRGYAKPVLENPVINSVAVAVSGTTRRVQSFFFFLGLGTGSSRVVIRVSSLSHSQS